MWWKTIEGDITTRPSLPLSIADTTGSILDSDSRVDTAELQDHWWDNLDRTKLSSSRRFSSRKSLNPADTNTDSILSDGIDDISIKKKRVTLRPRANKSRDGDNFLKVMNESSNTVQSEPVLTKRKSKSPTRSDIEVSRKKTRMSRSHLTDASRDDRDDDSMTSNDSDVVVKPRPKAFEKRFTSKLRETMFGNVLQNEEAGTSATNISKTPGLMGPPKGGSVRTSLSSESRKLNLISDESESDMELKRARPRVVSKSRKNLSVNPFDEILSGHVEEKNSQPGCQANESGISTKSPNKSRESPGVDRVVSSIANADRTPTRLNDSTSKTKRMPIVHSVTFDGTENLRKPAEKNRRAISEANEIHVSISRPHSELRDESSRRSALTEDSRNRIVQDWESSDSEDDAIGGGPSKYVMNVSKESISTRTSLVVPETILSSTRISHSQNIDKYNRESDKEEEMAPDKKRSLRSTSHRRTFADSAYSLPDKERSDSPNISLSENEDDGSTDNSKRNKLQKMSTKKLADRSISREPSEFNASRKSSSRPNTSRQKIHSDGSIGEHEIPGKRGESEGEEKSSSEQDAQRRILRSNLSAKEKVSPGRKTSSHGNVSGQRLQSDDSEDEVKSSQKSKPLIAKKPNESTHRSENSSITQDMPKMQAPEKTNKRSSKKSASSSYYVDDEASTSRKNVANLSARQTPFVNSISDDESERIESEKRISEEEAQSENAEKSNLNSSRSGRHADGRNTNDARNSFAHADNSGQRRIGPGDAADAANSKSANLDAKRKASAARNSSASVSVRPQESAESDSEEDRRIEDEHEINSRTTDISAKRVVLRGGIGNARGNVSRQIAESGDSEDEVADSQKPNRSAAKEMKMGTRLSKNSSTKMQTAEKTEGTSTKRDSRLSDRPRTSRRMLASPNKSPRQIPLDDSMSEEEIDDEAKNNSKSASFAARKKSSTARKSTSRGDSSRNVFVSEKSTENDEAEDAERSTAKSTKRSLHANTSSSRRRIDSDESVSEEEEQAEDSRKSQPNKTRGEGQTAESSGEQASETNISRSMNISVKGKIRTSRTSAARGTVSRQRVESDEEDDHDGNKGEEPPSKPGGNAGNFSEPHGESDDGEEEVEVSQPPEPLTAEEVNRSTRPPKNSTITRDPSGPKKSTLSTAKNFEAEDSTVDSEVIPPTAVLAKELTDRSVPVAGKGNVFRTQKNITDFFQSKFTRRSDDSRTMDLTSFDQDRLRLVREEMESMKQREMKALRIDVTAKNKETRRPDNAPKAKHLRSKENNLPRSAAKPARVVDKAYIVNGTVYKRPKLPRPKSWVTDRLYRHLWKKMEPKFDLSTRRRSEKFVEQLAEVVAVTIRRKKYDSYRLEVEALTKEMARLGIIKTRNDFYDFCYDFLPYDFRVKATPILMPGNIQNIPYDPETLDTPILAESSRSG